MENSEENQANVTENECPRFFQNSSTGNGFSEEAGSHEKLQIHFGLSEDVSNRSDGWVKSLQFLPHVTSEKIDKKLVGLSTLPKKTSAPQAFRNKRHGYRLWKEGFVRSISVRPNVKGQCLLFLVKSRVHASMKNIFYNVYTHLNQTTGDVMYAKCNCKAGQGGCCKHVAALLFTLVDFVNLDAKVVPNDLTCTQVS